MQNVTYNKFEIADFDPNIKEILNKINNAFKETKPELTNIVSEVKNKKCKCEADLTVRNTMLRIFYTIEETVDGEPYIKIGKS